jgi:hypothetical protein
VSPSSQWRCDYDTYLPHHQVSHDQRSCWHSEGTSLSLADTHPISPFQCHLDQISKTLEHMAGQQIPKIESARSSVHYSRDSPGWHCCAHSHCDRKYRRAQELRRHIKDKHRQPKKCPFCRFKWTRPGQIRAHLKTDHEDRFTEKEQQEIHRLRGWNNTMTFLANHGITRLPRNSVLGVQATSPCQAFPPSTPWNYQQRN